MSGTPDAVVETRTTVTASDDDAHDGVLSEPDRQAGTPLWYAIVFTLCLILLVLAGTFAYLAIMGQIDSAALVGLFMGVLASCMDLYRRRQS